MMLEELLTSRAGFDLDASALQRAICRAADGLPLGELLADAEVRAHFGCERSRLGLCKPVLVAIVAGVRSGKSLTADAAAVHGVLTCDLSPLKSHELPRFAIVGPTVDNAMATHRLLVGSVEASPVLSRMVVGEPTQDTLVLRRPDGRQVEIVVVAAHRGAVTLRSRWLAGFVFDEVALFGAETSGAVISAEELLRAGETRLLPGAQGWCISSPFGPSGLLYDLYRENFGKPGRVLVVHAPTRAMNPAFPEEQVEAVRNRAPDVAAREYDAQWVDADTALLDGVLIDRGVRAMPLEERPTEGARYVAAWDAATRGNAWGLVIARADLQADETERVVVALARQWQGSRSAPLDVDAVIDEIAQLTAPYGISEIHCDEWGADPLKSISRAHGLELLPRTMSAAAAYEAYDTIRTLLSMGRLELAPHPLLVADLKGLRKKATSNALRVELPRTADGRHADLAPACALAVRAATDSASSMSYWDALQRYADSQKPQPGAPPPIVVTYRDLPNGEVEVTGTEKGRAIGRAWFPKGNASRVTWELGSPDRFREAAWADFQKRRLLFGKDETS